MLHSLFEETPDDRCYNLHLPPKYNQKTDGMSKPSLPCAMRSKCGLSGLDNQGATCYLNSLLQTLLFTPEFRESLMRISHLELETPKVRIIPIQLRRLFARLLLADRHAIQTTELTNSFGWTGVEELVQHDVQELNRILFSAIESSLKGTSGENIIHKLYCGVIVNQIKCLECHSLSEKMEDFQDLTVIVSSMQNLENSLSTTYSTKETMCEGNQYFCGNCLKKVDAEKQTKISSLPSILTFSLMRFSYDFEKRERYKETENFSFPLVLDMEPYCSNISEKEKFVYELFSIVIHNGSGYGGHYHVYIRDVDCLGNWEVTNTAKPELVLEEKAEKSLVPKSFDKNNVLQIFIDILSYQVNFSTHVNNLCLELTKFVGSSWKTLYRKRHGSIIKFLLKHDDVFSLNDLTSIVSLKKGAVKLPKPSSPNPKPVENKPLLDCEKQWFDFNDENIKPVSAKEIEKHFKGNESAYMLFYRQKCLQRPNDAKQNPLYAIPDDLVELVRDENLQDEKDRVVYEDHLNTINLQVSFGAHYRFTNGVLKPVPDTLNTVLFPIDQRKTLGELRDQIYELSLSP